MPDDHSAVEPPLPIPNRTVKRRSADDSEQLARESRTSSGNPYRKHAPAQPGRFALWRRHSSARLRETGAVLSRDGRLSTRSNVDSAVDVLLRLSGSARVVGLARRRPL